MKTLEPSLGRAHELLAAGKFAKAEEAFPAMLATNENNAAAWAGLGAAAGASGHHDLAAEYFGRAAVLAPTYAVFLHNHGEALRQCGKPAKADRALRRALELDADLLPAHEKACAPCSTKPRVVSHTRLSCVRIAHDRHFE